MTEPTATPDTADMAEMLVRLDAKWEPVRITSHAVSRYRERVEPLTEAEVIAKLDTPRIRQMVAFGVREIVLPRGHHAVVQDGAIVTIRPKPKLPKLRIDRRE